MTLYTKVEMDDDEATVTLTGYAGQEAVPTLDQLISAVALLPVRRLVFDLERLTALPSAGVRSLLMAHQTAGPGLRIEITGARGAVAETVRLSGFSGVSAPPIALVA
ncbi:STAS domain-containing protein [Saccharothrix syringae]|uniref:Anti-sigma factor antagonist n=1 Tax=Saccharothrix syringae TaxID=103733 RepID=A0A5Q0H4Y8_SACSY|nr:STAS domain-containing protein [Saccharothrix syringae]QFZ20945.1 anti-sigma factor antagonist [Saccharothrix syringae]